MQPAVRSISEVLEDAIAVRAEYDRTVRVVGTVKRAESMAARLKLDDAVRAKMVADARNVKPSVPNSPASLEAIARVERELECAFPDDYRAFLRAHDGWPGFSGEEALLSTSEMLAPEWRASIHQITSGYEANGDLNRPRVAGDTPPCKPSRPPEPPKNTWRAVVYRVGTTPA